MPLRISPHTMARAVPLALYLLTLSTLPGCFLLEEKPKITPTLWTRTEIYCGLSRPAGGGEITDKEWQAFVDEVVTPKFPTGLTIVPAVGQWREVSGKVAKEPSRILVVLHDQADTAADGMLKEIAQAYARRFDQETVLMVRHDTRVEFIHGPKPTALQLTPIP